MLESRRYQADKKIAAIIAKRHPWLYRDALSSAITAIPPKTLLRIVDGNNAFLTHGIYEPHAAIAIRLLFTQDPFDISQLDRRLIKVITKKAKIAPFSATSGFRLINGEGDGFPGLTCDVFGKTAVWQPYLAFWDDLIPRFSGITDPEMGMERHVVKPPTHRKKPPYPLSGELPAEPFVIEEAGLHFHAWPVTGQKTGFYLDLKEVRLFLPGYLRGKTVLNCFANTGAFTLIAKKYGATETLSIEADGGCAEKATAQMEANGLTLEPREWLTADVFEELPKLAEAGKKFDVVILDPPNMCTKKTSLPSALKGWEKLLRLGKELTASGGKLVAVNCSSFMPRALCDDAVKGLKLRKESAGGLPPDHTVRADFPEGDYLKWWVFSL